MTRRGCTQKFFLAMGVLLGFLTLPVVIFLVSALVTGAGAFWVTLWVLFTVMLGLPAALFAYLGLRTPPEKPVRIDKTRERRVLQLAAANDGELTASKLALGSQLRLEDCQEVLDYFERAGVARSYVDEEGQIRFVFPELQQSLDDDEFMRRLEQEDPHAVLDFDLADIEIDEEYEEEHVHQEQWRRDE